MDPLKSVAPALQRMRSFPDRNCPSTIRALHPRHNRTLMWRPGSRSPLPKERNKQSGFRCAPSFPEPRRYPASPGNGEAHQARVSEVAPRPRVRWSVPNKTDGGRRRDNASGSGQTGQRITSTRALRPSLSQGLRRLGQAQIGRRKGRKLWELEVNLQTETHLLLRMLEQMLVDAGHAQAPGALPVRAALVGCPETKKDATWRWLDEVYLARKAAGLGPISNKKARAPSPPKGFTMSKKARKQQAAYAARLARMRAGPPPAATPRVRGVEPNAPGKVFYISDEWRAVRYQALKSSDGKCQLCGRSKRDHGVILHVDHIKARSKHPELAFDLNNLQILCEDCNLGKSNKDDTDWRNT